MLQLKGNKMLKAKFMAGGGKAPPIKPARAPAPVIPVTK